MGGGSNCGAFSTPLPAEIAPATSPRGRHGSGRRFWAALARSTMSGSRPSTSARSPLALHSGRAGCHLAFVAGRSTIAKTWLGQSLAHLAAARDSAGAGHHESACFQSQEAGEKALKAFLYSRGCTSIVTHSLRRLLQECVREEPGFGDLDDARRLLDQCYTPTRYPNGLDEEIPRPSTTMQGTPNAASSLLGRSSSA